MTRYMIVVMLLAVLAAVSLNCGRSDEPDNAEWSDEPEFIDEPLDQAQVEYIDVPLDSEDADPDPTATATVSIGGRPNLERWSFVPSVTPEPAFSPTPTPVIVLEEKPTATPVAKRYRTELWCPPSCPRLVVREVIDAVTLDTYEKGLVRLRGIAEGNRCGAEGKKRLEELAPAGLTLMHDGVGYREFATVNAGRDRMLQSAMVTALVDPDALYEYGPESFLGSRSGFATLLYLYTLDGRSVNEVMLREGFADIDSHTAGSHSTIMDRALQDAVAREQGCAWSPLWR